MKNWILSICGGVLFLAGMNGIAQADLWVDDSIWINVGAYDDLIAQETATNVGGNPADELYWINSVLGTTYVASEYVKFDSNPDELDLYSETAGPTATTERDGAFKLNNSDEYFLLKTGNNGTTPDYRYFLFKNNINTDYAVFLLEGLVDNSQDEYYYINNWGAISHTGEVGEPGEPVPEPATMLLFGVGLIGVAGLRLRKKNK